MEKGTSTITAAICAQNTIKIIIIVIRATIMVSAGLAALCGIVAISKVEFSAVQYEAENLRQSYAYWKTAINFNSLMCCILLLLASGVTLILEIVMLIVSLMKKTSKVFVIVDTVLSSISAGVLFSLAVGVATVIDAHATWFRRNYSYSYDYGYRSDSDYDYSSMYPTTEPGKAAAAFGFLTAFALIGLIVLIWIKFCLGKRQNSA